MATAEYRLSPLARDVRPGRKNPNFHYVRLTMTPNEHQDMMTAVADACAAHAKTPMRTAGERGYLVRLRTLYDDLFKPSEAMYYTSRAKREDKNHYVRLTMTQSEHSDMLAAVADVCAILHVHQSPTAGARGYLGRLRKLYDDVFKPSEKA